MEPTWNENEPIYLQIRQRILQMIMGGQLPEGEKLPSVRQVATDLRVNPLTVMKAYQMLVDEDLVEKRRGLGMFVKEGATGDLVAVEKRRFLEEEWPRVLAQIVRIGLEPAELLAPEMLQHAREEAGRAE